MSNVCYKREADIDLEHAWVAEEHSFAYEPPGETHTLFVPEDVKETIAIFTARVGYTFVNPQGNAVGMRTFLPSWI